MTLQTAGRIEDARPLANGWARVSCPCYNFIRDRFVDVASSDLEKGRDA